MKLRLFTWYAWSKVFGAVSWAMKHWGLMLVVAFIVSPMGPHLRLAYSYHGDTANRYRLFNCLYVGSRGLITPDYGYMDRCPVLAWIDTRRALR